ncbi:MAG: ribosomal-processing cysteine protease Prp [Clostridia bacterium]|nr:ribosomal-processing cysteine protease Prp [Clostridia bacterium]
MVNGYYTDVGGELRLDIEGHGNIENIEGLDVMCAAVSTLTNALAINVLAADKSGWLEEEATVYVGEDGEGRARILCKPRPEYYSLVKMAFAVICNGLSMLSTLYPKYVGFIRE